MPVARPSGGVRLGGLSLQFLQNQRGGRCGNVTALVLHLFFRHLARRTVLNVS